MREYVLDSNAVIIYLHGTAGASQVGKIFREAREGNASVCISSINWAECRYVLVRSHGAKQAKTLLDRVALAVEIVAADQAFAELAGDLRCRFNASLADAFAAILAMSRKATLVTSDPEFAQLQDHLKLLRLPHAIV